MKTPLWTLLLMGLFVSGRSDCQRDCLSCSRILPKDNGFDTLVRKKNLIHMFNVH